MREKDPDKRSKELTHLLTKIINQCRIAGDRLYKDPSADINDDLWAIRKTVCDCNSIMFCYDKE